MLVREIAQCTLMPLPYLSKIFQRLGEAGIVETKRGYKGGVKLLRPPGQITLLEIDVAVECAKATCASEGEHEAARRNTFWEAFHKSYRDRLRVMTLAEVLTYGSANGSKCL